MDIHLVRTMKEMVCFSLETRSDIDNTCQRISKKLNLPIEAYNKKLIEKVIKHDEYIIVDDDPSASFYLDIVFPLSGKKSSTYIERFKDEFANELILLKMEEGI